MLKKLAKGTELKAEQDKIVKRQTYNLSLLTDQSYSVNDVAQLYLILLPIQLVYIFSLRFSGSKFLINLRRQFRVRKFFSCT